MIAHRCCRLSLEAMLVVPSQGAGIRTLTDIVRNNDPLAMERIVVLTVVKLFANAPTDLKLEIRGHGDVAQIKQAVYVAPQKQAVSRLMRAPIAIGADVCRLALATRGE